MSVRRYGIYLAYAPTTDLRGQGLGRHLANMLRGAESRGDVRFVLACPGWLQPELKRLFSDEQVSPHAYELISTPGMPLALRIFLMFRRQARWVAGWGYGKGYAPGQAPWLGRVSEWVIGCSISARNPLTALVLLPPALVVLGAQVLLSFMREVKWAVRRVTVAARLLAQQARDKGVMKRYVLFLEKVRMLTSRPQSIGFVFRLYRHIEVTESSLLVGLINRRRDIDAWYSPTAFWPEFNDIRGPKLMCVPDVVLSNFPVGFALTGDDRMMHAFARVEYAVRGADHYVTYSQDVKWNTVVGRYGADPGRVHVVPHGDNSLGGFLNPETGEGAGRLDEQGRALLREAMRKSSNPDYTAGFANMQFKYLFYASQFRPNKNVLTLLRAYEWLLRDKHVGVKLILTGNLEAMPEIRHFIEERGLTRDVLCLRGLSVRQLTACYLLARLAVNPSLSEGGFPFTFDEALSVGTPVVMSRIGVTEEVITDPELQADMLFDPYDWQDMACKIEWALENREQLYQKQKPVYDSRSQRTWAHVVDDYVGLLDAISRESAAQTTLS